MKPSQLLLQARRRAGLTQRELARRTDVPQSTVARIETEAIDPRATTLDALLRECGDDLDSRPRLGIGVDRTLIRSMLEMTPEQRFDYAVASSRNVQELAKTIRWTHKGSTRKERSKR